MITTGTPLAGCPLASAPICGDPPPQGPSYGERVAMLRDGDLTYLLELVAYPTDEHEALTLAGIGAGPIGAAPLPLWTSVIPYVAAERELRFSDTGYISQPSDDPPATGWRGRLAEFSISRSASLAPEAQSDGRATATASLTAADGGLDDTLARNVIDGRPARILVGPRRRTASRQRDFFPLFTGVTVKPARDSDAAIEMEDHSYLLDQPVQRRQYAGTGGPEGPAEIAGQKRPFTVGLVENLTPVLSDAENQIYDVHDGRVYFILAVRDRASPYSFVGDYPTREALIAADIAIGEFATCLATGQFRPGSRPAGLLTCDVMGDADPASGGYVETIPQIVGDKILRQRLGWSAERLSLGTVAALASELPGVAGWHTRDDITGRDAMSMLLKGSFADWYIGRDGRLRLDRPRAPDPGAVAWTFGPGDIIDLREVAPPGNLYPATHRRRIAYRRNWTEQRGEDLWVDIADADRAFIKDPWRVTNPTSDASIQRRYLRARDPDPAESYLRDQAAAEAIGAYGQALHGVPRRYFEITVRPIGHLIERGWTVRVFWPQHGLGQGRLLRAYLPREEMRAVTFMGWG